VKVLLSCSTQGRVILIKNLEEQKAKAKAAISKNLDEYYEAYSEASNQEGFDINTIERLMVENQRKLRETLDEVDSELADSVETIVKKNARNAGPR
jgi:hypothetical protein